MSAKVIRIDPKSIRHINDLQRLFNDYATTLERTFDENIVDSLLKLPYFKGFICYAGDQAAGFALCYESFSTYTAKHVLNIHDLMIASDHRGAGYSKLLLQAVDQFCIAHDYVKVTLEVEEDNEIAKRLYDKHGFKDFRVVSSSLLHWQKNF